MSNIPISLSGTLAADPQSRTLPSGRACASFRLAVNHWHLDKATGEFVDDGTSWFAVDCYGALASNVSMSLKQGMTVMVQGGLRIREWTTEERTGRTPTVVAEHIGPDLRYGTANYQKSSSTQRPINQAEASSRSSAWGNLDAPAPEPSEEGLAARSPVEGERLEPNDHSGAVAPTAVDDEGVDAADESREPGNDTDDAIARTIAAAAAPF